MTAKEYLQQAHHLNLQINSKLEQIQTLNDIATKANATLSFTPPSATPNVHSMEDVIVKMADMKTEINTALNKLLELKRSITTTISKVESTEQRVLLELRYLGCKTWDDIAYEMGYTTRNVHILHSSALRAVVVPE